MTKNTKDRVVAWKMPPFRLDKSQCGLPLTRQLCANFEQAIESGYYAPGDKIPPVRAQMGIFKVSLSVAEDAMIELVKTGKVYARPRIGTIVADRDAPARRGSIIHAFPGYENSYYSKTFGATFSETVQRAGYACTTVYVPIGKDGSYDLSTLDRALLHEPDLVVLLFPKKEIVRHLSRIGVRFVGVGQEPCRLPGCLGLIRRARNAATSDFFRHCREAGVRTIHQLYFDTDGLEVLAGVPHPGLRIDAVRLGDIRQNRATMGHIRRTGYEGFLKLYKSKRKLPDLLFLTDDVMAAGVILALERLRIRVPEDVKLVSWIHHGDEPPAPYELTRIETEPVEHGRRVAEAVLRLLAGQEGVLDVEIPPVYKVGESFPRGRD